MPVKDWIDITERTLAAVDGLTDEQMAVVRRSLDESFNQISRDMLGTYRRLEGADPRYIQVELAKLKKANIARQILSPDKADQFEVIMQTLLEEQTANGVKYADLMTVALSNPPELVQQFGNINIEAVAAIAKDGRKRLKNHSEEAAGKIIDAVANNLLQGGSMAKLTSTISGQLGLVKHRAENIARTSTMTAFNQASKKRYEGYGVKYVQIIALVDKRTTPWCRWRHMRIVEITSSMPPFHFQCRTTTAPVDPAWLSEDDLKWMQDEMAAAKKTGLVNMNRAPFDEKKPKFYTPTKFKNNIAPFKPKKQAIAKSADKPVEKEPAIARSKNIAANNLIAKGKAFVESNIDFAAIEKRQAAIKAQIEAEYDNDEKIFEKIHALRAKGKSIPDSIKKERLANIDRIEALEKAIKRVETDEFEKMINKLKENGKKAQVRQGYKVEDVIEYYGLSGKKKTKQVQSVVDDYFSLVGGVSKKRKGKNVPPKIVITQVNDRAGAMPEGDAKLGWAMAKKNKKTGLLEPRKVASVDIGRHENDLSEKQAIYHELSHHLEARDADFLKAAEEFVLNRSTSTPQFLTELTGVDYGTEKAYPDDFYNPYVGKVYYEKKSAAGRLEYFGNEKIEGSSLNATEVLSMGIEVFADPSMVKNLRKADQEHVDFIVGVILENHATKY